MESSPSNIINQHHRHALTRTSGGGGRSPNQNSSSTIPTTSSIRHGSNISSSNSNSSGTFFGRHRHQQNNTTSSYKATTATTATDVPQALFGAWDWRNYQTTLGAMLTIFIFTFAAGTFAFEDPVQRTPVSTAAGVVNHHHHLQNQRITTSVTGQESPHSLQDFLIHHVFGFARSIVVSLTCSTQGELTLFLTTMLMSGVDLERILGSIKLREALIILGLQRIFLQQIFINYFLFSFLLPSSNSSPSSSSISTIMMMMTNWSFAPSASWMAVTVSMMRRILVPPRRCFRLFGLPLDEQTVSDLFVFQMLLVSEDRWCFVTSGLVALLNCSKWSPIHLRSRFFPRLWEDDVEVKEATVLARFLPGVNEY